MPGLKNIFMNRLTLVFFLLMVGCTSSPKEDWTSLFNGVDFTGWDTWLAAPHPRYDVPGLARDSAGRYLEPIGLNKDPLNVFEISEEEGKGLIHISGQGWGALTTQQEYENFHFSVEYKWGEKRWAPRDSAKRDSGILYFCVGDHGAGSGAWMQSQECQVQEGDTGDYWSVAGAMVDVTAESTTIDGSPGFQYRKNAPVQTLGKKFDGNWNLLRCIKGPSHENPRGEWNKVEVYALGGKCVHVVNGKTVLVLDNSRRIVDGKEVPLTKGKFQLQTEGAEIFYREVKVRKIEEIPSSILP